MEQPKVEVYDEFTRYWHALRARTRAAIILAYVGGVLSGILLDKIFGFHN
jgi:hypothetical protein